MSAVGLTQLGVCAFWQSVCDNDSACDAWTYVIRGADGGGDCCLKSEVPCPRTPPPQSPNCTSGSKVVRKGHHRWLRFWHFCTYIEVSSSCVWITDAQATTLSNCGAGALICTVDYTPNTNTSATFYDVPVSCGDVKDSLRLLADETALEVRVFSDVTMAEAYFQGGRVAMTVQLETRIASLHSFNPFLC